MIKHSVIDKARTWAERHKERVYINNLANIIHITKERLTGRNCFGSTYDDDCTCYRQAMEHFIKYGMATDNVDAKER